MKHYLNSCPIFVPAGINDYVYHFYVETVFHNFVEVPRSEYMDTLKMCRHFSRHHHVDVRSYDYRCFNLFLEL